MTVSDRVAEFGLGAAGGGAVAVVAAVVAAAAAGGIMNADTIAYVEAGTYVTGGGGLIIAGINPDKFSKEDDKLRPSWVIGGTLAGLAAAIFTASYLSGSLPAEKTAPPPQGQATAQVAKNIEDRMAGKNGAPVEITVPAARVPNPA